MHKNTEKWQQCLEKSKESSNILSDTRTVFHAEQSNT